MQFLWRDDRRMTPKNKTRLRVDQGSSTSDSDESAAAERIQRIFDDELALPLPKYWMRPPPHRTAGQRRPPESASDGIIVPGSRCGRCRSTAILPAANVAIVRRGTNHQRASRTGGISACEEKKVLPVHDDSKSTEFPVCIPASLFIGELIIVADLELLADSDCGTDPLIAWTMIMKTEGSRQDSSTPSYSDGDGMSTETELTRKRRPALHTITDAKVSATMYQPGLSQSAGQKFSPGASSMAAQSSLPRTEWHRRAVHWVNVVLDAPASFNEVVCASQR